MQNDSIDTLLLRHYGSAAPAPVNLEQQLSASVRRESAAARAQQEASNKWNQRRVSRRQVLQLMTFSSAGLGVLAVGINALHGTPRKLAYSS